MIDIQSITDRELLERIYVGQLKMQMDIDLIRDNVIRLHRKVDPAAFNPATEGYDNPTLWKHYEKLAEEFDEAYVDVISTLEKTRSEEFVESLKKLED